MHLRRALLLFAIVLGLAAVAASVSRPRDDPPSQNALPPASTQTTPAPTAEPAPSAEPAPTGLGRAEVFFDASDPRRQRLQAGQAATVFVSVPNPGQVEIADLGISSPAEPVTPARFDVLTSRVGRYPISFVPAAGEEPLRAGTLVVEE